MKNCSDLRGTGRSATALARQLGALERAFQGTSSPAHDEQSIDGRRRWRALHVRGSAPETGGNGNGGAHAPHWTDPLVVAEAAMVAAVDACRTTASQNGDSASKEEAEILDGWILDVVEL